MFPKYIKEIISALTNHGYESYLVGGCCRDILMNKKPKDWDIATNALPNEIQKIFPDSMYLNKFGTVVLKPDSVNTEKIEITTYRSDSAYSDNRHPDEVKFVTSINEDLSRRDFTINSMAISSKDLIVSKITIIDTFNGQNDLKNSVIRAINDPYERFKEDALRLIRAIRFSVQLGFTIEEQTKQAIIKNAFLIKRISSERIRDELLKIMDSDNAYLGIKLLTDLNILQYIVPELLEGVGVTQNKHHVYTVFDHNFYSLKYACEKKYSTVIKIASLFHDIGKPRTKNSEGPNCTFYKHDIVGAKMADKILSRLKFDKEMAQKIVLLIRYHMFYYNVGEVTESSIRRLLVKVGVENIDDLICLRQADRIGSGVPKAEPYKLRHFKYLILKVCKDPLSVKMLKINGDDIMKILKIRPGPRVGLLLNALLAEVLDNPKLNTLEGLTDRVFVLNKLNDQELKSMEERIEFEKKKIDEEDKRRFYV